MPGFITESNVRKISMECYFFCTSLAMEVHYWSINGAMKATICHGIWWISPICRQITRRFEMSVQNSQQAVIGCEMSLHNLQHQLERGYPCHHCPQAGKPRSRHSCNRYWKVQIAQLGTNETAAAANTLIHTKFYWWERFVKHCRSERDLWCPSCCIFGRPQQRDISNNETCQTYMPIMLHFWKTTAANRYRSIGKRDSIIVRNST